MAVLALCIMALAFAVNYVIQTVRISNYEGDKKLRAYFDQTGNEEARKLMREAGYDA